jgi:hypothetical protein
MHMFSRFCPNQVRQRREVFDYASEQDAALGLLGESSAILTACGVDFVIVGGWRPYLFHSTPISHPGTFDVDVLLRETTSRAAFDEAADQLLRAGYLRAPKNLFQAHRILSVRREPLVYHVDFLHRKYAPDVDDQLIEWGKFQSIAGPGTDVIFQFDERSFEDVRVTIPAGTEQVAKVPLATEVGVLATKGRSASTAKRKRDAFDIFLIVKQSRDYEQLVTRCRTLRTSALFRLSLEEIRKGFEGLVWSKNAATYLGKASPDIRDPEGEVRNVMAAFFDAIGGRGAQA